METCRICLKTDADLKSLDNEINDENGKIKLIWVFTICTGLEEFDKESFPHYLCKKCYNNLVAAYRLRQRAWRSHEILVSKSIKAEKSESEDECDTMFPAPDIEFETYSSPDNKSNDESEENLEQQEPPVKEVKEKKDEVKVEKVKVDDKDAENRFLCHACGRNFKKKQTLIEHIKLHTGEKPFKCEQCDYATARKHTYLAHVKVHEKGTYRQRRFTFTKKNSSDLDSLRCEFCDKWFKSKTNLRRHIIVHYPEKHKVCEFCGKKFSKNWAYQLHRKTHTRENLLQCAHCEQKFIQKSSLINHLKRKHEIIIK